MSFTFLTQIIIGAGHALVTSSNNLLLAAIATGGVLFTATVPDDKGLRIGNLDETMGMLLRCDRKAARACIVIRAVQAFVSVPIDLGITHIADSMVQNWLGFRFRDRRRVVGGRLTRLPLAFAAENGMNDNATRFLDFKELVSHCMTIPPSCDAGGTHVIVRAIQTLMPDTTNG